MLTPKELLLFNSSQNSKKIIKTTSPVISFHKKVPKGLFPNVMCIIYTKDKQRLTVGTATTKPELMEVLEALSKAVGGGLRWGRVG